MVQPNTKPLRFERAKVICECERTIESNFEQFSKGQIMEFGLYFVSSGEKLKMSKQGVPGGTVAFGM